MSALLADDTLDQLFRDGRSYNGFLDKPVSDATLKTLAELTSLGPTEANTLPGRFVFVKSPEARQKLLAAMAPGNQAKTRTAPVSVIAGYDLDFYEMLPKTFPHADARSWYVGSPDERLQFSALRSASARRWRNPLTVTASDTLYSLMISNSKAGFLGPPSFH